MHTMATSTCLVVLLLRDIVDVVQLIAEAINLFYVVYIDGALLSFIRGYCTAVEVGVY